MRLEPTKLVLIGTRTTYQATGDALHKNKHVSYKKYLVLLCVEQPSLPRSPLLEQTLPLPRTFFRSESLASPMPPYSEEKGGHCELA